MKQRIVKAKNLLMLRKNEVKRYKEVLKKTLKTNRDNAESALEEYYQKMREAMDDSEQRCKRQLKMTLSEQQTLVTPFIVSFHLNCRKN